MEVAAAYNHESHKTAIRNFHNPHPQSLEQQYMQILLTDPFSQIICGKYDLKSEHQLLFVKKKLWNVKKI